MDKDEEQNKIRLLNLLCQYKKLDNIDDQIGVLIEKLKGKLNFTSSCQIISKYYGSLDDYTYIDINLISALITFRKYSKFVEKWLTIFLKHGGRVSI